MYRLPICGLLDFSWGLGVELGNKEGSRGRESGRGRKEGFPELRQKIVTSLCHDGGLGRKRGKDSQKQTSPSYLLMHAGIFHTLVYLYEDWGLGVVEVSWGSGNREFSRSEPDRWHLGPEEPL